VLYAFHEHSGRSRDQQMYMYVYPSMDHIQVGHGYAICLQNIGLYGKMFRIGSYIYWTWNSNLRNTKRYEWSQIITIRYAAMCK